jgi:ribose transport system substrate-binding protein
MGAPPIFDLALLRKMAKPLGRNLQLSDSRARGVASQRAINQAIALQPDGIVLGTIDADEQAAVIRAAAAEGVVVVDWPSSSRPTSISTAGR